MSTTNSQPAIGYIGPGEQGLPMATAIAAAGYPLLVWARHPGPLSHTSPGAGGQESASERPWWRFWR
jgi:3-hydroxyisobutyrate dehydrogenase-like beta-hydroxyacid dehydrogenase